MKRYRLHLLGADDEVRVAHWFQARDDETAFWLAERLFDACSDIYTSFALWRGARRLRHGKHIRTPGPTAAEIVERRQQMLAFHEEALRDSALRVAESRRLLDRLRGAKPV